MRATGREQLRERELTSANLREERRKNQSKEERKERQGTVMKCAARILNG